MFVRPSVRLFVRSRVFFSLFWVHFWCRLTNRKRVSKGVRIDLKNDQKHAFFEKQSSFCNRKPLKNNYRKFTKFMSSSKTLKITINYSYILRIFRGWHGFGCHDRHHFWASKWVKNDVDLRIENASTTWSKMELFLMFFFEIEADHNLVWACHAVTQTRFLFVSRQYSKTSDYIRNEWFFNNFERFRLRFHVPRRGHVESKTKSLKIPSAYFFSIWELLF